MNRLLGKKKAVEKPTLEDASARLDNRNTAADSRIGRIDAELMKCKNMISASRGPTQQRYKQRAMQLLQQKRMYQSQQNQLMQQQFNMDQLQFTMETIQDTKVQMQAMKAVTKTMKKENKKFSLDSAEKMQDELQDIYEDVQEMQEIMGRTYEVPEDIDEDDLLGELNALSVAGEEDVDYLADALAVPSQLPEMTAMGGDEEAGHEMAEEEDPGRTNGLEAELGL